MLKGIIDFSLRNKFMVLLTTIALVLVGIYSVRNIPLDAIPDLSDVQVIIYTEWQGQAPQIVQDQVTYPLTTKMLSVPKAKVVRGYSFYGFSFVYVIFEDGTDPYWARSRVLEYLSGLTSRLPKGVAPSLGPDATGVGWAFMYSISSNIMSLGGIAIAIGAMVDAVIIMIENAHKHLEHDQGKKPHWDIIRDAAVEVGATLFYSLLVITVSFIPVFTLQAQEGRLFKPLAFTKTYSMAAAALLSITLAPILMGYFIRGKIPAEERNPINRVLIIYLNTRSAIKTAIVMLAVPFSLVGAFAILHWLGYNLSVAVWVGIIALAGLDAETGVVMLLYLDLAYDQWIKKGLMRNITDLRDAIYHGAVKRVRPKAMTASVIIAGLLPILWSHGAGADVMKRIATPMIGGVMTSTMMELIVYPAIFYVWRSRRFHRVPAAELILENTEERKELV